mmetsp:Transcript_17967/g.45264  ORF Transcript_17967/g.45264 Transcript_17967/m.45264 type:complete len:486 (+) Transcript_17967:560-2017(+)
MRYACEVVQAVKHRPVHHAPDPRRLRPGDAGLKILKVPQPHPLLVVAKGQRGPWRLLLVLLLLLLLVVAAEPPSFALAAWISLICSPRLVTMERSLRLISSISAASSLDFLRARSRPTRCSALNTSWLITDAAKLAARLPPEDTNTAVSVAVCSRSRPPCSAAAHVMASSCPTANTWGWLREGAWGPLVMVMGIRPGSIFLAGPGLLALPGGAPPLLLPLLVVAGAGASGAGDAEVVSAALAGCWGSEDPARPLGALPPLLLLGASVGTGAGPDPVAAGGVDVLALTALSAASLVPVFASALAALLLLLALLAPASLDVVAAATASATASATALEAAAAAADPFLLSFLLLPLIMAMRSAMSVIMATRTRERATLRPASAASPTTIAMPATHRVTSSRATSAMPAAAAASPAAPCTTTSGPNSPDSARGTARKSSHPCSYAWSRRKAATPPTSTPRNMSSPARLSSTATPASTDTGIWAVGLLAT